MPHVSRYDLWFIVRGHLTGGFDLGLERAGMECRWQVEIDPWCQRVLAKHWPNVPKFGDIRELTGDELEPVDVICGGFPCQDISRANQQQRGLAGVRSGLWFELARLIRVLRPRYVLLENVPALRSPIRKLGHPAPLARVLGDLAALGFDAEWHSVPASALGAPHVRDRVWIISYAHGELLRSAGCGAAAGAARGVSAPLGQRQRLRTDLAAMGVRDVWAGTSPEPGVLGVAYGISSGMDRYRARLKGCGNAVVAQIPELLGRWIIEAECRKCEGREGR